MPQVFKCLVLFGLFQCISLLFDKKDFKTGRRPSRHAAKSFQAKAPSTRTSRTFALFLPVHLSTNKQHKTATYIFTWREDRASHSKAVVSCDVCCSSISQKRLLLFSNKNPIRQSSSSLGGMLRILLRFAFSKCCCLGSQNKEPSTSRQVRDSEVVFC